MNGISAVDLIIVALFSLMIFRAFRSGSRTDMLLCAFQAAGLVLLPGSYHDPALYLLIVTAALYLLSQVLTGARPISRLLPVAGAGAAIFALLA